MLSMFQDIIVRGDYATLRGVMTGLTSDLPLGWSRAPDREPDRPIGAEPSLVALRWVGNDRVPSSVVFIRLGIHDIRVANILRDDREDLSKELYNVVITTLNEALIQPNVQNLAAVQVEITAAQKPIQEITGLSLPMISYLRKQDLLVPAYEAGIRRRGKVRYYSYRDLLVAKLFQKLRMAGVELPTLKEAIKQLHSDELWNREPDGVPAALRFLHTDGKHVFMARKEGFVEHLRADRQGAFAFLINVSGLAREVRSRIPVGPKRRNFSLRNREMIIESVHRSQKAGRNQA